MICAIVLAAGRSARMGTNKLLLPIGEKTVITRIVDELLRSPVEHVFVVLGLDAEKMRDALHGKAVSLVENTNPEGDMLSSVRCGLHALPATCEAALVALGDQPGVTRGLVGELVQAFRETNQGIIAPSYEGKRGHPLLVGSLFFNEVLHGCAGVGLRALLKSHPEAITTVPVVEAGVLADLDTPEDYQSHLASSAD